MNDKGILDGHRVRRVSDPRKWAEAYEKTDRRVAQTKFGDATVSTVFLALDHGFGGPPLWFETMVFGGTLDGEMDRYATWDEAERGHAEMVARVGVAGEPTPPLREPHRRSDANDKASPSPARSRTEGEGEK